MDDIYGRVLVIPTEYSVCIACIDCEFASVAFKKSIHPFIYALVLATLYECGERLPALSSMLRSPAASMQQKAPRRPCRTRIHVATVFSCPCPSNFVRYSSPFHFS